MSMVVKSSGEWFHLDKVRFMTRPAKPSRRERSKADKERRIHEAALALFREKGFESTTTKEIAERADIATGTLFLYVQDKHELLFWVWRERIGRALEAAAKKPPKSPGIVDGWMHYFQALFKLYHEDEALARHFVREQVFRAPQPRDTEQLMEFMGRLAALVEQAKQRGEARPDADSGLAALSAFLLYIGALIGWLNGNRTQRDALADLRRLLEQQVTGLLQR